MTSPNIANTKTIIGKTDVLNLTTVDQTITTNAISSNQIYKLNSLIISNVDGVNDADVNVHILRNSVQYFLAKTITVPADATLIVISKDMGIYIEEGDSIVCSASANNDLQAFCSYEVFMDV